MPEQTNTVNSTSFNCKHCEKQFSTAEALEMHASAKHFVAQPKPAGENFFKKHKVKIIILAVLFLLGAGTWMFYSSASSGPRIGAIGSTHIHADFKVYIDGQAIGFSLAKYQVRAPYMHVEGGNGDVMHMHATGVTLGMFFESVGMKFSKDCFTTDDGQFHCNGNGKTLKFYVNNATDNEFDKYVFSDLDKILISYGNETPGQIQQQLASITDKARIESQQAQANPALPSHVRG